MAFKERLAGFMPDMKGLTDQFNSKFDELIGELRSMHGVLNDIRVILTERLPQKEAA